MLFRHNELGEQITAIHLEELKDADRERRLRYYDRRYEMFKGVVTDPNEPAFDINICVQYFPKGKNETDPEYLERMKVWNPQGRVIIERLTDLTFKGGVEYKFVPVDPEDTDAQAMADAATESFNADREYNKWDIVGYERVLEPLGIAQISDWLDYRRYDPRTGELYDKGGRIRFIKRLPFYAEPVVHPDNVTEIIGACYIYNLDNNVISKAVSLQMALDGKRKLIAELWLDPSHDTDTGEQISAGCYARFEDETLAMPAGKEDWASENKYKLTPVVFWQSIDMDESQYNAEAFVDRFVDMWLKLSRVDTNKLNAIQYIISQLAIIASPEATPDELPIRHNAIFKIPQGDPQSDIRILDRKADLTPEDNFSKELRFNIGQAGNYSADLMDMEGIGAAAQSGISRKIVYAMTVDCVDKLRKNYAESTKELMFKCASVKAYENGGEYEGIDLKRVKPEVVFHGDIIPVDEKEELERELTLVKEKVKSRVPLIIKYNDDIDTAEEAEKLMGEIDKEQPEPPAQFPFEARRPRGADRPPNENPNA